MMDLGLRQSVGLPESSRGSQNLPTMMQPTHTHPRNAIQYADKRTAPQVGRPDGETSGHADY